MIIVIAGLLLPLDIRDGFYCDSERFLYIWGVYRQRKLPAGFRIDAGPETYLLNDVPPHIVPLGDLPLQNPFTISSRTC
jgi:hypothetical protein